MGSPIWKDSNQNMQVNGRKVCMVQPKAEIDLQLELTRLSTPWGYLSSLALCVTTFGTIALMRSFFLKPDATFNDYLANVVPLFSGFNTILGVSEMATRITAARYGVKLSPSFLVPSNWTGCLGVMNNYESLLPNQKALFDIPVARTASAYLTSLFLAVAAFVADGSFNGGDNALYIRHQFFFNNPLLSFIQFVIGPYTDNLGNVLPYTVEGVGVPVDPLAFAGLLEYFSALCSIGISPFIFMYISVCLKYLGHVQNTPRNVTPCPTLFVASLGPTASEQELVQVFSRCPGYLKLKMQKFRYAKSRMGMRMKSYGFCWGVERAIEITYEAKKQFPEEKIWITNEIIHNPTVSKSISVSVSKCKSYRLRNREMSDILHSYSILNSIVSFQASKQWLILNLWSAYERTIVLHSADNGKLMVGKVVALRFDMLRNKIINNPDDQPTISISGTKFATLATVIDYCTHLAGLSTSKKFRSQCNKQAHLANLFNLVQVFDFPPKLANAILTITKYEDYVIDLRWSPMCLNCLLDQAYDRNFSIHLIDMHL
ncbi:hypothetical protein POM88_021040 [Heracleum sosnowskyi]|uniref:4-hydroxy-3-methylbut-2-enyl diphosphate reductase n=1 Tax=Heracleum sosnowskyi TaxID=360622 RepID=A0AAD8IG53_9APIA|nr:hypothetical protein POM88_021040 [Heracleum sosnowskyi]